MPQRRTAAALAGVLALVAAGLGHVGATASAGSVVRAAPTLAERAVSRPGTAGTDPARPNIVLVLTDDQTMDSLAKMPYLSSRTDWSRFDNAWIENALCCPSRATILSGRYDTRTQVINDKTGPLFDPRQTIATWLQGAGYRTGLFGKYLNSPPRATELTPPPGWTDFQATYGHMYAQYHYDLDNNGVNEHHGTAPADYEVNVVAARAKAFVAASGATPFFLYYAPTATHGPWRASPARTGMYANARVPHPPDFDEADVSDKPAYIQARGSDFISSRTWDDNKRRAWAAAASVDDSIKALDRQLVASGVFRNTIEIFMTDNGFSFGEHRWTGKRCEYAECERTPLLVRWPGHTPRLRHELISNVDLAPTIAELAGVTPGGPVDGASFAPLLRGDTPPWRDAVLEHWSGGDSVGRYDNQQSIPIFWGVRQEIAGTQYLYVELDPSQPGRDIELYDETADPYELTNVAGEPAYATRQSVLAATLVRLKGQAGGSAVDRGYVRPAAGTSTDPDDMDLG